MKEQELLSQLILASTQLHFNDLEGLERRIRLFEGLNTLSNLLMLETCHTLLAQDPPYIKQKMQLLGQLYELIKEFSPPESIDKVKKIFEELLVTSLSIVLINRGVVLFPSDNLERVLNDLGMTIVDPPSGFQSSYPMTAQVMKVGALTLIHRSCLSFHLMRPLPSFTPASPLSATPAPAVETAATVFSLLQGFTIYSAAKMRKTKDCYILEVNEKPTLDNYQRLLANRRSGKKDQSAYLFYVTKKKKKKYFYYVDTLSEQALGDKRECLSLKGSEEQIDHLYDRFCPQKDRVLKMSLTNLDEVTRTVMHSHARMLVFVASLDQSTSPLKLPEEKIQRLWKVLNAISTSSNGTAGNTARIKLCGRMIFVEQHVIPNLLNILHINSLDPIEYQSSLREEYQYYLNQNFEPRQNFYPGGNELLQAHTGKTKRETKGDEEQPAPKKLRKDKTSDSVAPPSEKQAGTHESGRGRFFAISSSSTSSTDSSPRPSR